MDISIFNETKKILNIPLIETKLIENKHLIFIKYTSELYYKYTIELLEILCKKSKCENKKLLFHTCLNYLLKILYNCGNNPYLNNYDLLILSVFSIGIKSIENQHKSLSLNKIKRIYPEKFSYYNNEDIKIGEIISIKLLNYNINTLTPYECLFYLMKFKNYLYLADSCVQELDNIIFQGVEKYVFKRPLDLAKESIEKAKYKEKQRKNMNNIIDKSNESLKGKKISKNENIIPLKAIKHANNESISTNASSTANISNYSNNCNKNYNLSFKSKSFIKNNISREKNFINSEEKNEKKLKLNIIYNNANNLNLINNLDKKGYIYTCKNNFRHKKKKNNKIVHFNHINKKKNQESFNIIENVTDKDKNLQTNINLKMNPNSSSPNIFRKPIKVYKKNLKLAFSGTKQFSNININNNNDDDKYKDNINSKMKNIINNKNNNCIKLHNNMNFNYDRLNELCHKINFDIFINKNGIDI